IARSRRKNLFRHRHPAMQAVAELREVSRRVFRETEVGQEKPLGLAFQNRSERPSPEFQVDVGRPSRRPNKTMSLDAAARGVTHEGRSLEVLEIADVMRSM